MFSNLFNICLDGREHDCCVCFTNTSFGDFTNVWGQLEARIQKPYQCASSLYKCVLNISDIFRGAQTDKQKHVI